MIEHQHKKLSAALWGLLLAGLVTGFVQILSPGSVSAKGASNYSETWRAVELAVAEGGGSGKDSVYKIIPKHKIKDYETIGSHGGSKTWIPAPEGSWMWGWGGSVSSSYSANTYTAPHAFVVKWEVTGKLNK